MYSSTVYIEKSCENPVGQPSLIAYSFTATIFICLYESYITTHNKFKINYSLMILWGISSKTEKNKVYRATLGERCKPVSDLEIFPDS